MKKLNTRAVCAAFAISAAAVVLPGVSGVTAAGPLAPQIAEAATPALHCKLTQGNMLKLVKKYDRDAYYILNAQNKAGDRFAVWMQGERLLVDAVDTTVHEEFHSYTFTHGGMKRRGKSYVRYERYYVGNKKTRKITHSKGFKTSKATGKLPKRYRTFRYNTYVAKGSRASANLDGVYGLLNEFTAYYWGMHANRSLYPYLKKHAKTYQDYSSFVSSYTNGRDAYAEFYYWTLVYLDYARKHSPKTYKAIVHNKAYMKTLKGISSKYRSLIKGYKKDVNAVNKRLRAQAVSYTVSGTGAYETLSKQIKASKYKKVRKAIAKA